MVGNEYPKQHTGAIPNTSTLPQPFLECSIIWYAQQDVVQVSTVLPCELANSKSQWNHGLTLTVFNLRCCESEVDGTMVSLWYREHARATALGTVTIRIYAVTARRAVRQRIPPVYITLS